MNPADPTHLASTLAETLATAWRDDTHVDPAGYGAMSVDDGYAAQQRFDQLLDVPLAGWKIAATSDGGQRHIGVEHPLVGRLYADRVYPAPATLLMRNNRMRVAEAEFCFRFGRDLHGGGLDAASVLDHVDALFPAIEVPDSRFTDFLAAGAAALVADNACAREFVLGEAVAGEWREIDLARFPVRVYRNGELAVEGVGADALGGPLDALTWFVNETLRRGWTLKSGQLVTTGVLGRPVAIAAGDHIVADFGVLGEVSLALSDAKIDHPANRIPGEPHAS